MMERRILPTSSFIKRYLKANKISQKELAAVSGYTEKQVSLIMNDEVDVSPRFARAISSCVPGLSEEFILRYADRYKRQLKEDKEYLDKNDFRNLSKELCLGKVFKHISSDPVEQVRFLLDSYNANSLLEVRNYVLENKKDLNIVYSKDQSKLSQKDNVIVRLWSRTVMNQAINLCDDRVFVGREKTKQIMHENKDLLSVSNSEDLITNIEYICERCGIYVAFVHNAPATYVRGLSFSMNKKLFIVLTDRFKKIENVIFAFVHEMVHITRGDISVDNDSIRFIDLEDFEELSVDEEASEYLIPKNIYHEYIRPGKIPTISDLIIVSEKSNTTIGLVVSRYHHESKDYTRFWQYLNEFNIKIDLFGNE